MEWLAGIADTGWSLKTIETAASLLTAVAAVVLAIVATVLAIRMRSLGGLGGQANVTVNLEPNPWAINQVDLLVANSGTAPAYDVRIVFDPPLPAFEKLRSNSKAGSPPLGHISLLRSSQLIRATLCQYAEINHAELSVSVSWSPQPQSRKRRATSYRLSMADYDGAAYSGAHV
jgi:hypothetical protein